MGLFDKISDFADDCIYSDVKYYLKPRDGFTHVVMVNCLSNCAKNSFDGDEVYTNKVDTVITSMQEDGYEIVDIKFSTFEKDNECVNKTLIMYR